MESFRAWGFWTLPYAQENNAPAPPGELAPPGDPAPPGDDDDCRPPGPQSFGLNISHSFFSRRGLIWDALETWAKPSQDTVIRNMQWDKQGDNGYSDNNRSPQSKSV